MQDSQNAFSLLCRTLGIGSPYRWQQEAFKRLAAGDVPGSVVVPTAAGKTMLLVAYVAALATQALHGSVTLPRRLVHVVNRRILVDEASRLAERMAQALAQEPQLAPLRAALTGLSAGCDALAVSLLRGGAQDNGAWSLDPSTPAIILATPDMLGSRLLFRGYGLGRSRSATHAGLLGCDTLVIHDEAHLAPAFTTLLRQVQMRAEPGARLLGRPPLQVMEMTATLHAQTAQRPLVCDVSSDLALAERMRAAKQLTLHTPAGKPDNAIRDALLALALEQREASRAVAIFVNTPQTAVELAQRLQSKGIEPERIVTLTGTMRGHERNLLTEPPAFRRFDPGPQRQTGSTCYFIATAAGEIGLDIDADVGLFDLTTLDRFIQRCGRINRRGQAVGDIHLVHADAQELPELLRDAGSRTLALLQELPAFGEQRDVSPLALSRLCVHPGYVDAVQAPPAQRRLENSIVDMLAMTSLRLDEIRCPVPATFIHGLVEEQAELLLAWRNLPRAGSDFTAWMEACPLAQAETAKLPLFAARTLLEARLKAVAQIASDAAQPLALALDAQGLPLNQQPFTADTPVGRWIRALRPQSSVLLACHVGGLDAQGVPSDKAVQPVSDVCHVAMHSYRIHVTLGDEGTQWELLTDDAPETGDVTEDAPPSQSHPSALALLQAMEPEADILFHDVPAQFPAMHWQGVVQVWCSPRQTRYGRSADTGDQAAMASQDRALGEHLDLAAKAVYRLAEKLALPSQLQADLTQAAREHDHGKQWARWQQAIGNTDLQHPLGKSGRAYFNHRINDGYRHELGSLVDRGAHLNTLANHLVASHHGWARPHFNAQARAKPGCEAAAQQAAHDFAALSRHLGPWAVAYLEAVLKAADVMAETQARELQSLPVPVTSSAQGGFVQLPVVDAVKTFMLDADAQNFGEYLAALGLAALLHWRGHYFTLAWLPAGLQWVGVDEADVRACLRDLTQARSQSDALATVPAMQGTTYPPLELAFADGPAWPLNHWLHENLRDSSRWKLGAGQTSAAKTLDGLLPAGARSLELPDFQPRQMLGMGGLRMQADSSKFRFDAATNWVAADAGFSLNENDAFKSTRPWVELLSALGLQHFFLPPADTDMHYFIWRQPIPMLLALAAAKGLLPSLNAMGYMPVLKPNGKMKDVFTSRPIPPERTAPCTAMIQVI